MVCITCCNNSDTRFCLRGCVYWERRVSRKNLHAMVAAVSHDDAAVAVDGDATIGLEELPLARALAADGADTRSIGIPQHLHAMDVEIRHDQVVLCVKRQAAMWITKLHVVSISAADCAQEACTVKGNQ